jgi:hypothetical protein
MRVGIIVPAVTLAGFDDAVEDDAMDQADGGADGSKCSAASLKQGLMSVAEKAEGFR